MQTDKLIIIKIILGSKVRPNLSMVQLKKSEVAPVRPAVLEKKGLPVAQQQTHILGSYHGLNQ